VPAAATLNEEVLAFVHEVQTEPWRPTTARAMGPKGLLIGVCHTPWLREP
jgi:hypothetical protein